MQVLESTVQVSVAASHGIPRGLAWLQSFVAPPIVHRQFQRVSVSSASCQTPKAQEPMSSSDQLSHLPSAAQATLPQGRRSIRCPRGSPDCIRTRRRCSEPRWRRTRRCMKRCRHGRAADPRVQGPSQRSFGALVPLDRIRTAVLSPSRPYIASAFPCLPRRPKFRLLISCLLGRCHTNRGSRDAFLSLCQR